jgi:D-alanyl-D-alanine carboxypeptidase
MKRFAIKIFLVVGALFSTTFAYAQSDFNPSFIISDPEMQDYRSLDTDDIQNFLTAKGSFLKSGAFDDVNGNRKTAAEIIHDAAINYQINPKFLLVTLQKEQSLVTDDTPTQRQLDWAAGYAVCDGCYLSDPKVQKYKGLGKQVDGAAGIMRWYYDNTDHGVVKKKDSPIRIDDTDVTPGSWATAFLYTYTPHLHGNANFWRIWSSWFTQILPSGTLVQSVSSSEYWLIDNGFKRKFKTKTALITRADPKLAIKIDETDLQNYKDGPEISFPNYSLLFDGMVTYLLDYDTLRPFDSQEVVRALGFNPDEPIDVDHADIANYEIGPVITASTTAPQGVIYKITDAANIYYFFKDEVLYPISDPAVLKTNFINIPTEKHKLKDLKNLEIAATPISFADGTLLQIKDSNIVYVVEKGKKRPLADDDTFLALGYKKSNIITVNNLTAMNIPTGDRIFINSSLKSAKTKYLGDSTAPAPDQYGKAASASYLVAEFPSGRILSGKNIDSRKPIASLTKLLTAYEAIKNDFKLTNTSVYNGKKYNSESNTLKLADGDKVRNKDMFYSMLVASDNSAARFVAQNSNTDENDLVRKINLRLEEWGADLTTVADVTGLSENNKSTARDLLKIFTKVVQDKNIMDAISSPTFSYSELRSLDKTTYHSYKNTNQIIANIPLSKRSYRILATKTGYTDEAKAVLVMLIEAKKTKKQYVVITLGNPNTAKRFEEPHKIAEWISTNKITLTAN